MRTSSLGRSSFQQKQQAFGNGRIYEQLCDPEQVPYLTKIPDENPYNQEEIWNSGLSWGFNL